MQCKLALHKLANMLFTVGMMGCMYMYSADFGIAAVGQAYLTKPG